MHVMELELDLLSNGMGITNHPDTLISYAVKFERYQHINRASKDMI